MPEKRFSILQGYLSRANGITVRVRVKGEQGYLTIKGPSSGASREEFEYAIPKADALKLLQLYCPVYIEKTRHEVAFAGKKWEVDVFGGANAGLIVAEIELDHEEEPYEKPEWVTVEVTLDKRYSNAALCEHPYSCW